MPLPMFSIQTLAEARSTVLGLLNLVNINARHPNGTTALFQAAASADNHRVLELLLWAGADVNMATTEMYPLHIHGINFLSPGATPLHVAVCKGLFRAVELLLAANADTGRATLGVGATPLYLASCFGHASCVEMLLGAGADVNKATTVAGSTPLYIASQMGRTVVVEMLLGAGAGADVNKARTDNGLFPLYIASWNGHAAVVEMLLGAGADVNKAKMGTGETPLCAASLNGRADVVTLLLGAGADVNKAKHVTPLLGAIYEGHAEVVKMLLGAGADVNKVTRNNCETPLFTASDRGRTEVVEMLLGAGADVNKARADDGKTPLYGASFRGHAKVVKMLLDAGADVNKARTDNGETPLTISAYALDDAAALTMVQMLAMAGANLAQTNTEGQTAVVIASRRNRLFTADWLDMVAGYSAVQICVSLGKEVEFTALLRRREWDLFTRPTLAELGAGNGPLLRLCQDAMMPWAPVRHHLFHQAHRSTVMSIMLVGHRPTRLRGGGWQWLGEIPTEIWFMIAQQLGRTGWGE